MEPPSYVYFLRDGMLVKIGASIHPYERRKQSHYFANKRVLRELNGTLQDEWFGLSDADLDSITALKFWYNECHAPFCECHPRHSKWCSNSQCQLHRIYFGIARPKEVSA